MTSFRYYCLRNMSILVYVSALLFRLADCTAAWQFGFSGQNADLRCIVVFIISAVLFLGDLIAVSFYIRFNKLTVYSFYSVSMLFFSFTYILLFRQDPWFETLFISQIAMSYMLSGTHLYRQSYGIAMNVLFLTAIVALEYLRFTMCTAYPYISGKDVSLFRFIAFSNLLEAVSGVSASAMHANFLLKRSRKTEARIENSIKYLADHDPLTKLKNRRSINQFLEECSTRKEREGINYALCIFDIDNFKHVNDVYGHDCGDFILSQLTQRLRNMLPKEAKIGRWGGEEFLIVFPSFTGNTVFELDTIRASLSAAPYIYNSEPLIVTATFGISSSRNLPTPDAVITDADRHLYEGKTNGKNRLVVSELF